MLALEVDCVRMPNRDRLQFRVVKLKPFDEALRQRLRGQAAGATSVSSSAPLPAPALAPASTPAPAPAPALASASAPVSSEDMLVGSKEGLGEGGSIERLLLHVRGGGGWDPELLAGFLAERAEGGDGEIELCIREESRILRVLLGQHYRLDAALERALGELRGVESVERVERKHAA